MCARDAFRVCCGGATLYLTATTLCLKCCARTLCSLSGRAIHCELVKPHNARLYFCCALGTFKASSVFAFFVMAAVQLRDLDTVDCAVTAAVAELRASEI